MKLRALRVVFYGMFGRCDTLVKVGLVKCGFVARVDGAAIDALD